MSRCSSCASTAGDTLPQHRTTRPQDQQPITTDLHRSAMGSLITVYSLRSIEEHEEAALPAPYQPIGSWRGVRMCQSVFDHAMCTQPLHGNSTGFSACSPRGLPSLTAISCACCVPSCRALFLTHPQPRSLLSSNAVRRAAWRTRRFHLHIFFSVYSWNACVAKCCSRASVWFRGSGESSPVAVLLSRIHMHRKLELRHGIAAFVLEPQLPAGCNIRKGMFGRCGCGWCRVVRSRRSLPDRERAFQPPS